MTNTPKFYGNSLIQAFLADHYHVGELCEEYPAIDDVFSGALSLKTAGSTSTRALSRRTVFQILQSCQVIDIDSVNKATGGRYAYKTLADYAALARVVAKALERLIPTLPKRDGRISVSQSRRDLDAPYTFQLRELGLV